MFAQPSALGLRCHVYPSEPMDTPRSVDIVLTVAVTGHLPYVGLMPEAESGNSGTSSLTDVIGIGTLTRLIPRELVDEVIASLGRKELRKNKLPARVMVYFVMAMALFQTKGFMIFLPPLIL